jgi:Arc/MetJ-type ribon-helix-helix transcriptional regulator
MIEYDNIISTKMGGSTMVRTTITLAEEEFAELKRLAAQQDRSISWLLRHAFRLSKARLESGEPYAAEFDRIWREVGRSLRHAGVRTPRDVDRLVREVRVRKGQGSEKASAR